MIALLLQLVIVAIVCGLIVWLCVQIPFVAPYAHIIRTIVLCLFIIYCLYLLINLVSHAQFYLK